MPIKTQRNEEPTTGNGKGAITMNAKQRGCPENTKALKPRRERMNGNVGRETSLSRGSAQGTGNGTGPRGSIGQAMTGKSFDELKGSGIERTEPSNGPKSELAVSEETQLMDSKPRSINMNEALSQANSWTDSSINVLSSSMKRVIKQRDLDNVDQDVRALDLDKVNTVVSLGRELANNIKTKIDILKLAHETGCYEYDVEEEPEEDDQ